MNTIEIRGIVPGAGKTTTLVLAFLKSNLKNKVILTPSNKSRQNIQNMLNQFNHPELMNSVFTIRRFKKNFARCTNLSNTIDPETGNRLPISTTYATIKSNKHFKKIWNIWIDEASMISRAEIDDLRQNWKIQNLILAGDSLQFDPIGSHSELQIGDSIEKWDDEGEPYSLNINHQILLNKSMRARDEKLVSILNDIKNGNVLEGLEKLGRPNEVEYRDSDWHIAYTNKRCETINSLYPNPRRWIVSLADNEYGFAVSEIFDDDAPRLNDLREKLEYENVENPNISFEKWKSIHLKPAYTLTCHKLQGTTIEDGDIYIDLEDIVNNIGLENNLNVEDRAKLLQKYLYIAISRATKSSQLNVLFSYGKTKKGKLYSHDLYDLMKFPEYFEDSIENFSQLYEHFKPMIDETIWKNPDYEGPAGNEAVDSIVKLLDLDGSSVEKLEGEDEWKAEYAKSHSVKHKSHKKPLPPFFYELVEAGVGYREFCEITGRSQAIYWRIKEEIVNNRRDANVSGETGEVEEVVEIASDGIEQALEQRSSGEDRGRGIDMESLGLETHFKYGTTRYRGNFKVSIYRDKDLKDKIGYEASASSGKSLYEKLVHEVNFAMKWSTFQYHESKAVDVGNGILQKVIKYRNPCGDGRVLYVVLTIENKKPNKNHRATIEEM